LTTQSCTTSNILNKELEHLEIKHTSVTMQLWHWRVYPLSKVEVCM